MWKRMLKITLEVLLFLCIISFLYLTILRGIFLEDVFAKTSDINISKIEELKHYQKEDLHKILDGVLKENEIPPKIIDEILEDKEQKEVIDHYIDEVITATKKGEEIPSIPKEKVETILNQGIQKYNEKYNANLSPSKIKNLATELINKADTLLKFVNSNLTLISNFQLLLSDKLYYGLLLFTILLIILFFTIYKKETFFSLGGINLFSCFFFLFMYFILKIEKLQNIFEFLPINILNIRNSFFRIGLISSIVGIIFLLLYKILIVRSTKKKDGK